MQIDCNIIDISSVATVVSKGLMIIFPMLRLRKCSLLTRRYFLHITLSSLLVILIAALFILLKNPINRVDTDDFRERYWKETLLYRSHPNFCSQPVTSELLATKLDSELARSVAANSIKCDLHNHKLGTLAGVSVTNVYSIEYNMDFDCLRRGLSSKTFFDCPPDIRPCHVPNITHVAWYGMVRRRFRFHHYISLRSSLTELRPHALVFWYDSLPEGEWFAEALRFARDRTPSTSVIFVHRRGPEQIYERRVAAPEHQSDVVRLEALLQFGGIYLGNVMLAPFYSSTQDFSCSILLFFIVSFFLVYSITVYLCFYKLAGLLAGKLLLSGFQ